MEERVGFSQCTGMLSGDAHVNTQAQGLSLNMEECPQKRHHDAGGLKQFSYLCITGKSCFSYETRDPVASLGGTPRRWGSGGQTGDSRQGQTDFHTDGQSGRGGRTTKH